MDFVEKLGDTLVSVGKDVTQKAKEASSIAKLRLNIRAKEAFVKEQYTELGKLYYEENKNASREDQPHFAQIDEALDDIAQMEQQILELKKVRRCPECGNEAADTAEYFSVCGAKLSAKEEAVIDEEIEVVEEEVGEKVEEIVEEEVGEKAEEIVAAEVGEKVEEIVEEKAEAQNA